MSTILTVAVAPSNEVFIFPSQIQTYVLYVYADYRKELCIKMLKAFTTEAVAVAHAESLIAAAKAKRIAGGGRPEIV
jgi:hypothetical protein